MISDALQYLIFGDQPYIPKKDPSLVISSLLMYKDLNCKNRSEHSFYNSSIDVDPEGFTKGMR